MNIIKNVIVYPICGFANRLRFISTCYSICKKNNWNMQIYWETSEECNVDNEVIESILLPKLTKYNIKSITGQTIILKYNEL